MKAVILAGGTGTRLWPMSRKNKPKQFQKLTSDNTMLQETIERLNFLKNEDIYIATNKNYEEFILEQCPQIPKKQIIIEPALRDTATCIAYAATIIEHNHPGEVMSVIYSDHLIKDTQQFQEKLKIAEKIAKKENTLNIIEVKAKFPSTTLGYVQIGKLLYEKDEHEVYELVKFVEKPDLKTAKQFVNSFKYLWNTGYYVWQAKTILEQYEKYLPDTYQRMMNIEKDMNTKNEQISVQKNYSECQKISIDYAIMEKVPSSLVRIIPADFGWSDVGTWASLHDELTPHHEENIEKGLNLLLDTEGSLIYNEEKEKLIACFGLKDQIIVNTHDALLICPKSKSADLKKIIEKIQEEKKKFM